MGRRTCGSSDLWPSDLWVVGLVGRRACGSSDLWVVGLVDRRTCGTTPINALVENVERYAKATVVLHNYLLQTENALYRPSGFVHSENSNGEITGGHWRETIKDDVMGFLQIANVRGSRQANDAQEMREASTHYVNSDKGSRSWQLDCQTYIIIL